MQNTPLTSLDRPRAGNWFRICNEVENPAEKQRLAVWPRDVRLGTERGRSFFFLSFFFPSFFLQWMTIFSTNVPSVINTPRRGDDSATHHANQPACNRITARLYANVDRILTATPGPIPADPIVRPTCHRMSSLALYSTCRYRDSRRFSRLLRFTSSRNARRLCLTQTRSMKLYVVYDT